MTEDHGALASNVRSSAPPAAGDPGTPSRSTAVIAAAGVVTSAAFAAGCVVTQAVTVPTWRALEPAEFLRQFATSGPATGAVLLPVELAAAALSAATTYTFVKQRRPGRLVWGLATGAMVATILLLPAHFAGANAAFLDPAFPLPDVAGELSTWNTWNWLRTGLAVLGTATGSAALTKMITRR